MRGLKALTLLGFNEKEAIVYATVLQWGPATAYTVAQKSRLKRPTVYIILEALRIKNAVLKIPHPKKQIYIAQSPADLLNRAYTMLQEAADILPELQTLSKTNKSRVLYFDGSNEIKDMLLLHVDSLGKDDEIVGFYGHENGVVSKHLDEVFYEYNEYLKEKNIFVRGIVPDHPSITRFRKSDAEYNRVMKVVPCDEYNSATCIDVIGNAVRILLFKDEQGIVVESKDFAESIKQVFEMMWRRI